jgi:hypothetical protein
MAYGRGNAAPGAVRVYEYGVPSAPVHRGLLEGRDLALAEMRRRVDLWNRLVELDQADREAREAIMGPAPVDAEGKRQRRQLSTETKAQLAALDGETSRRVNELCQESGCYWPNYSEVKAAWGQARRRPGELRFHSRAGRVGKITTLLARGLSVADAFGEHGFLRIRHPNPEQHPRDALVSLRVGSDERRRPVFVTLPIVMHRPLPADCLIKSVSALREPLADRERWKVVFVLERQAGTWATQALDCPRQGSVALDVGWRRVPDGLRVAVWRDDEGRTGELILPERYLEQRATVERLQSHRQTLYNETLTALRAWLSAAAETERPAWLTEDTRHIAQWRRPGRLVWLLRHWTEQRFKGDEAIVAMLEAWQRRDLHLWQFEANLRDQALHWRREMYRVFAADLARRYASVQMEDFDLSQVARIMRPAKADQAENQLVAKARYYRVIAGVYELRQAIRNVCDREGVEIVVQAATNTTAQCAHCGSLETWDHRELWHTCSQCGTRWDQDHNAARNLLELATAGSSGAETAAE